ncbi:MAG: DUF4112 domain-containing protein [Limnothrix sp.]
MSTENLKKLQRIKSLSKLLDNAIAIPGTKFKIGLDSIIGLVPAVGDYLTLFVSAYIVYEAAQLGATKETITKMAGNVLVDGVVGSVPVVGDLFDFVWKSNEKNLALLEKDFPGVISELSGATGTAGTTTVTNTLEQRKQTVDWKPLSLMFGGIALVVLFATIGMLLVLRLLLALIFV